MWQLNSSSGFYKSPVCKCLLGASFISSFALHFPLHHCKHYFVYNPSLIVEKRQLWRLVTSRLAFLDIKDMMIGSILIYYFRIFERKYGSQKFMSHLLGTYIFSTMLEMALIYALSRLDVRLDLLPSGPFFLIYPLYVPYFCDIPRVELGRVMGIPMTGKSFQYFIGLQLASGSLESILVAMCGIVAGILWRHNFLKIQKLIFIPDFIGSMCHTVIGQFIESKEPNNPSLPMGATLELQRQEQLDRLEQQVIWQSLRQQQMPMGQQAQNPINGPGIFGAANFENVLRHRNHQQDREISVKDGIVPDTPTRDYRGCQLAAISGNQQGEVSEEQVQQLVDMGFSEGRARIALQNSNNDMTAATNMLLQES